MESKTGLPNSGILAHLLKFDDGKGVDERVVQVEDQVEFLELVLADDAPQSFRATQSLFDQTLHRLTCRHALFLQ